MPSLKADHRRPRTPLNIESMSSGDHEALFRKSEHRSTRRKMRANGRRLCDVGAWA